MNTLVSFTIAKLLKEKEFNKSCKYYYSDNELIEAFHTRDHNNSSIHVVSAPTIAEVVMWLYEKHGIWISVEPRDEKRWKFNVYTKIVSKVENISLAEHLSPTEAYSAAIEYCLEKLI